MGTPIDVGSLVTSKVRMFAGKAEMGLATGFFVEHKGQLYLVTNWHVVTGRHFQTGKVIDEQNAAIPDRIRFLAPCKGAVGEWMEVDWLLYSDANETRTPMKPVWLEHGVHHHKIDVVAIPIKLPEGATAHTIDKVNTVPKMLLTVSRDVFVLGYPRGIDGGRGFPIWKRGSIASEPDIQLDRCRGRCPAPSSSAPTAASRSCRPRAG
ncbi:MAG: hypothetical protein ISS15_21080 [Alphaproteobacteria bacterium]|nr:hypothetical protein [Reyranella sp.]MBL6940073.1 hypothetical protein [Alphaproteobacteria bacterium]MBL7100160.1 hypothetical protein [Alphaproteobacteria bacterium]